MLVAIYKVGSALILPNPKDVDYAYVFTTEQECKEAFKKNHNHNVDNHYEYLGKLKTTLYAWQFPLRELIEGEDIEFLKNYNILEHKHEYKEVAMRHIGIMNDTNKKWYHIYLVCKMFERNKTNITKEMITKAQKIHDKGVDENVKNYCLQQLSLIQ